MICKWLTDYQQMLHKRFIKEGYSKVLPNNNNNNGNTGTDKLIFKKN